jgi:hypothetical protein
MITRMKRAITCFVEGKSYFFTLFLSTLIRCQTTGIGDTTLPISGK